MEVDEEVVTGLGVMEVAVRGSDALSWRKSEDHTRSHHREGKDE